MINKTPDIIFDDGDAYERYMGVWSRLVGADFIQWLSANKNNSVSFKAFRRQKVNGISVSKPNIGFGQDSVKIPKIGRVRYNRHKKFYGDSKTVEVIREGH